MGLVLAAVAVLAALCVAAEGGRPSAALTLDLWLLHAAQLALAGLVAGGALWLLERATTPAGRPVPGPGALALYAAPAVLAAAAVLLYAARVASLLTAP